MNSLVSAIITTYKREPSILDRAIRSVLGQTYRNIELIVVNDAPEYEKRKEIDQILKKYPSIKYIVNEKTCGAGYSRNKGFECASGEYIAYLDDDDEWLPEKIEKMISSFEDDVALVYCDLIICKKNGESIQTMQSYPDEQVFEQLLNRNYIGGFSSPIIRASAIEYCGGMDEKLSSSQDADLWRRIAKNYRIKHYCEPLIRYYISDESITANPEKRLQGTLALLEKYKLDYEKYPSVKRKHINRSIQNYIRSGWKKEADILFNTAYSKSERAKNYYIFVFGYLRKWMGQ